MQEDDLWTIYDHGLLGLIYFPDLTRCYTMYSQMKSAINLLLQVKPWVIQRMHPCHWVATFARMKTVCGSLMQKWPKRHSNAACHSCPTVALTKAPLVWMRGVDIYGDVEALMPRSSPASLHSINTIRLMTMPSWYKVIIITHHECDAYRKPYSRVLHLLLSNFPSLLLSTRVSVATFLPAAVACRHSAIRVIAFEPFDGTRFMYIAFWSILQWIWDTGPCHLTHVTHWLSGIVQHYHQKAVAEDIKQTLTHNMCIYVLCLTSHGPWKVYKHIHL